MIFIGGSVWYRIELISDLKSYPIPQKSKKEKKILPCDLATVKDGKLIVAQFLQSLRRCFQNLNSTIIFISIQINLNLETS